jgi:hypothetical protein
MTVGNGKDIDVRPFAEIAGCPGIPQFDAEEFREYVEGFDITEEQKLEYLQTLWSIAVAVIDITFGTSSIHRINPKLTEFSGAEESRNRMLEGQAQQFNSAAASEAGKER